VYRFQSSTEVEGLLKTILDANTKHLVSDKLERLAEDPFKIAKKLSKTVFGHYYVNIGNRWSITFNIDTVNNTIDILRVIDSPFYIR
jgi:mRNA-degrading endonuclease RelE of RelBE toxin-antitoxin system